MMGMHWVIGQDTMGVTIMQGRAVLPTEIDPRTATDALNHPSRKSD